MNVICGKIEAGSITECSTHFGRRYTRVVKVVKLCDIKPVAPTYITVSNDYTGKEMYLHD